MSRMQQRRKTATNWTSSNEVLLDGELGIETGTGKWKLGDGATVWGTLPYQPTLAGTQQKRGNRVALFGDSILAADQPGPATGETPGQVTNYFGSGIVGHARTLLGGRFQISDYLAIGGNTTAQMAARVADVVASSANVVIILGGINSLFQDVPAAGIIADFESIYTALLAAGKTIVHGTILPATTMSTPARVLNRETVNRWIRQQSVRPGVVTVAWDQDITDPSTGFPAAGMTNDGTHPLALGAARLGTRLADTLTTIFPGNGNGDLPASNADLLNALPNGLMLNSQAPTTASGVSGVVSPNWDLEATAQTTISGAKEARTDRVPGEWLRLDLTGVGDPAGNGDIARVKAYTPLAARFTGTGGYVAASTSTYAVAEVRTENFKNAAAFWFTVLYFSNGGSTIIQTYAYRPTNFAEGWEDFAGTIYTPTIPTPAGCDTVFVAIGAKAKNGQTCTLRIGRTAVYFV